MTRPSKRPRRKLSWWRRKWYIWRSIESPLELRGSIIRLRHRNKHPYLALLRLFLPASLTSWSYPIPEPLPPLSLVANPSLCWTRRCEGDLKNLQAIPLWRSHDTPLRSLYRMYEAAMAGDSMNAVIGYEVEYFWYHSEHSWQLERIPDPKDPDPIRYAILACLVESMPEAFNFKLSKGMRRDGNNIPPGDWDGVNNPYAPYTPVAGPEWTKHVPPIDRDYLRDVMPERLLDSRGEFTEPGVHRFQTTPRFYIVGKLQPPDDDINAGGGTPIVVFDSVSKSVRISDTI
ncbi:conserved hypothetical protein [Histoplasma capsulatum G186AR]|uniref:Uncharacterized protein n=1 Tax=Ajellomyces capsulatus (strain G186AR / H82 / ATCC MYA-2454 / RMSCC 2432) TaxID=447093 RepID=C0NCY0_AJECG|nr:uncharacterized protein HCBG_00976 [Histoplasma capsulatum G186AR]EEH11521.1 conserved hypothetical protein [Histoplasma capsulatum G186AR]